jgi:hypothetical protein
VKSAVNTVNTNYIAGYAMTVVTDSYVKIALNAVPVDMEEYPVTYVLYVFTI